MPLFVRIIHLAPLSICALLSNAQPAIEWQKTLGGFDVDMANTVRPTSDGGYIIAGVTASDDGDVNGLHAPDSLGNIYDDAWLVKLDQDGVIEWQKCLGGTGSDLAYDIQVTSDGGYILVAGTQSNDGDVLAAPGKGVWVVKMSAAAEVLWQRRLGGSRAETIRSVQQTADGGYILAGSTNSDDGDASGLHAPDNFGAYSDDFWVIKLDEAGVVQWQRCLGGTKTDRAYEVQQTSDGGFVVAGTTFSNDGDVTGFHVGAGSDSWVVKLDGLGNTQWSKSLGSGGVVPNAGGGNEEARSVQQTSDGGYIVVGWTDSNNSGDVSANHGPDDLGYFRYDMWVVKLNATGNRVWDKCLGGTWEDFAHSVQETSDGGFIVAGETGSTDGDVVGAIGNGDFWVVRLNALGAVLWQKCMGGSYDDFLGGGLDEARSLRVTADGGYVVAGYTNSGNGDVTGLHSWMLDAWVVKLGPDATGTGVDEVGPELISMAPNPTGAFIQITAHGLLHVEYITMVDATGRQVLRQPYQASETPLTLDITHHDAGTYVLQFHFRDGSSVSRRVVKT